MSPLAILETSPNEKNYTAFIEEWRHEIYEIFPHFNEEEIEDCNIFLLEYGGILAGIFIYMKKGEELHVEVDYLIPEFRDLGVGQLFFQRKIDEFRQRGYKCIVALTNDKKHREYLIETGFKLSSAHPDRYVMDLD